MERQTKTPDEIKKGLGCVLAGFNDSCSLVCATCEFYNPGYNIKKRMEDTLDYIQQLEASYQQVSKALCGKENATLEEVLQAVSQVKAELAAVKRERDAAVRWLSGNCNVCRWAGTEKCDSCDEHEDSWFDDGNSNWEWEGVCPENTEVQDEKKQMIEGKFILDATCGTRSIWFDKRCPAAIYFDQRQGCVAKKMGTKRYERTMLVETDVVGDFRHLPFPDESFYHVVFDPPHLHISEKAWIYNMYGSLPEDWQSLIREGFRECMRVLKPYGTLVFKWSDLEITTREVINAIGCEPLYGHRSGKKMNTHWMVFMKGISEVKPNV